MDITLQDVQSFFEANAETPEVKDFANSFINYDAVDAYLNTDEGKKVLQPRLDKNFTKGLETWRQNNLDKIVNERINEIHPAESPAEKQVRELTERLSRVESEKVREGIRATASQELAERGLPATFADMMVTDSMEATRHKINEFSAEFERILNGQVKERLKTTGTDPQNGSKVETGGITKRDLVNMDYDKRNAFYEANPVLFEQIMKG